MVKKVLLSHAAPESRFGRVVMDILQPSRFIDREGVRNFMPDISVIPFS